MTDIPEPGQVRHTGLVNADQQVQPVDPEHKDSAASEFAKTPNTKIIIASIVVSFSVLVFGGWYAYKNILSRKAEQTKSLTPVPVRLKWLHQAQFAGMYVADKTGLYEKKGLKVKLNSFDYEHFPIDEVLAGRALFGVTGADEILIARSNGKKVQALAVIYQENPVVAYAAKSSGIEKPVDFIGKKLGMEEGVNVEFVVRAMLEDQGIDYSRQLTVVPIGYDVKPLIGGEVDIATGYITNEPIQAEEKGMEVNIISPSDYGVKMYADVLFTTEELAESNPVLVGGFVLATLEGWEYAVKNIDQAVEFTLQYEDPNNDFLNQAHQKALLLKSIPLIKPYSGLVIGSMDYIKWRRTYELLNKYGFFNSSLDVSNAYTTKFLP